MNAKTIPFFFVLFVSFVNTECRYCSGDSFEPLQSNVSFVDLQGRWVQRYYLNNWFGGTNCMRMEVNKADFSQGTSEVVYNFYLGEPYEGELPYLFSARESHPLTKDHFKEFESRNPLRPKEEREYIGDHIATDYDLYLMIIYCDKMTRRYIGDIFVREGVEELTKKQIRSIKRRLRARKMGFIKESRKEWCPKDVEPK